jgi:hypothetical protein
MTSPDKNNLSCSAVVFSACKLKKLFPAMYCVVRAVHEFDFRLVTNEAYNKWRPVERRSCSDEIHVPDWIYIFLMTVVASVKGSIHALQMNCIFFE